MAFDYGIICEDCNTREVDGPCCESHFQEMAISYTYAQLALTLNVVEALQQNEIEIPSELLDRMSKIVHRSGIRYLCDNCNGECNKRLLER